MTRKYNVTLTKIDSYDQTVTEVLFDVENVEYHNHTFITIYFRNGNITVIPIKYIYKIDLELL